MVVVVLSLAMGLIEYASSMTMYRLFLYEETIQEGMMGMFTFRTKDDAETMARIKLAVEDHGIKPSIHILENDGWLVPWVIEPYQNFLWASKTTNGAL